MVDSVGAKTTIEVTDREGQLLADAIRFIWKSGAVLSREGAAELMQLEDKITSAVVTIKNEEHGER